MKPQSMIRLGLVGIAAIQASGAFAQGSDELYLTTHIGSFKLINGKGSTSFSFQGTVLLVDVKGDIKVEGSLKLEFDDPKMKRKAYFGKGKITVTGEWRGIQWFGSELTGMVKGVCTVRLSGEFDNNLDTGFYWFANKPAEKLQWYTTGMTVQVPQDPRLNPNPVRRSGG